MNASSLQAIYRFEIATKIPLQGDISYEELAKLCQVHEQDLRRILRFSMAFHRIFREPRKGFVAHTAASRQLAENPNLRDTLGMWYEDCWPSMVQVRKPRYLIFTYPMLQATNLVPHPSKKTLNAMQRFPGQEPNQTVCKVLQNVVP